MVVCRDDDDEGSDEGSSSSTVAATKAAATTEAASSSLPSPWEEYLDSKSGNYYYYNPETKVTQWDRPAAAADGNDGELLVS